MNGSIAPCIFNLGTRGRWVVSFTPRPLYPREGASINRKSSRSWSRINVL